MSFIIKIEEKHHEPYEIKDPLILLQPPEIQPVEPLKFKDDPLFRREFLRKSGTTAIMLALAPSVLFTQDAEANPLAWLGWIGRAAFAGGISWFVNRTLDMVFPHFGAVPRVAINLQENLT